MNLDSDLLFWTTCIKCRPSQSDKADIWTRDLSVCCLRRHWGVFQWE